MFLGAMGSHADDIVGDFLGSEDWGALDDEAEPNLDQPPSESDA